MVDMADMLTTEAQVQTFASEDIVSDRVLVHELDLNVASDRDLDFVFPFDIVSIL